MEAAEKKRPRSFNLSNEQQDLFSVKGNIQKVVEFLNEHYTIHIPAHDPSKVTIECKDKTRYEEPPTFDDLYLHMIEECEVSVSETILRKIIRSKNYIKPFDPIKNYLDSVRGRYAGCSHIDLLCQHLKCREFNPDDQTYSALRANYIIRKWMVSAVALWQDNIPNEVMLTFVQAGEGYGKTSLVNYFIPAGLKDYSITAIKNDTRFDMEDAYTRYPFVIHDELVGITKGSIDAWKSVMSNKELLTKRRGDEFAVKRKRIGVALGTSNRNQEKGGFLQESFGYRRFGCIELEDIDWEAYIQVVDVDQMWAEALMLYESSGFDWKFGRDDFSEFEQFNAKYAIESDAFHYVNLYLAHPEGSDDGDWMNASEIINDLRKNRLIRSEHLTSVTPRTMGIALTAYGFDCKKVRSQGSGIPLLRYYIKRTYVNNINL